MNSECRPAKNTRITVVLKAIDSTQRSAADIARRVQALCSEFSVTILTSTPSECRSLFPEARTIRIPRIPRPNGGYLFIVFCWLVLPFLRSKLVYVAEVISLPAVLSDFRGSLVCYGNSHPMQHVLTVRKKGGVGSRLKSRVYGAMLGIALRKCDMIVAISPQLAKVYESFGVPPSGIKTTIVGVKAEMFNPPRTMDIAKRKEKIGVYHGTVSIERGLGIIIEGTRTLARTRRDFKIRLVGCDKNARRLVEELAISAKVEDLIEIIDLVPYSDIPKHLWSADFGISLLEPNIYFETSPPIKVLEFLTAGLPVIANDIQTHRMLLRDQDDSIIIPYDAQAFAKAMLTIIGDEQLRKRLSAKALKNSSRFSEEQSLRDLVSVVCLFTEGKIQSGSVAT